MEEKWNFTFGKAGRWWNNDMEIDIVAFDSTGKDIIFGECKYWEGKVGLNILTALEEKIKVVEWKKNIEKSILSGLPSMNLQRN